MSSRPRAVLELVRIFLAPSALADSLAGYALASALAVEAAGPGGLVGALLASVLLYSYGMAANDLGDLPRDRERAPGRPLPSGRLSVRDARSVCGALGAGGLLAGAIVGAGVPALAVLVLATAYDAGGKRLPVLGNLLMGACRSGNLLIGAAAAVGTGAAFAEPQVLLAAAVLGLFVAGITSVSVLEDRPWNPVRFHLQATPLLAVPLLLAFLRPTGSSPWINGTTNAVLLLWVLIAAQRRAASRRLPAHPAAVYVRGALGAIPFVDAGLVLAFAPLRSQPVGYAVALWALALGGWLWKRWWLQSGGPDT